MDTMDRQGVKLPEFLMRLSYKKKKEKKFSDVDSLQFIKVKEIFLRIMLFKFFLLHRALKHTILTPQRGKEQHGFTWLL